LRKLESNSLVDAGKQRMAAGRYGKGPGIVASARQGEYNLPQMEDWLELSSVLEERRIES
jgi:hypothetical protein